MKRKLLILGIGAIICFGSLLPPVANTAHAVGTNKQLEDKKKDLQNKRSNVQSEIKETKNEIQEINEKQAVTKAEIKRLDFLVAETNQQIREKEAQIEEANEEIERLQAEIEALKEQIKKRDTLLKERVRTIQENGGVINYIDVLLGAQSFGDFVSRVSAVTTFLEADRDLIRKHQEDKASLDNKEAEAQAKLTALNEKKAELEELLRKSEQQSKEKDNLLKIYNEQEKEKQEELNKFEDEAGILADQIKAAELEIKAWEKKQRELEAARKRQAANGKVGAIPTITNGTFMNPTTGSLTSHFGKRWGAFHSGIDIGKNGRTGSIPVVAAAEGTVIRASYDRSYGNVVMITHMIDGKVMTTVYAHLESYSVSNLQRVEKGQPLGYMGNTGNSTGPHLHFEIHNGAWNGSRTNAINPLKYVSY